MCRSEDNSESGPDVHAALKTYIQVPCPWTHIGPAPQSCSADFKTSNQIARSVPPHVSLQLAVLGPLFAILILCYCSETFLCVMLIPNNEMKHPLEHEWSFWLFTNEKRNWEDNLVELTSFNTVEDYWCLYHHMKLPSELKQGQDYAVFKKGVRPMWEDEANRSGGRWLLMLDGLKNAHMDRIWADAVLLLIGENFEYSDEICGVVVNVRGKSKISVWTRSNHTKAILEIGKKLKRQFRIHYKMHFYLHNSSKSLHFY